MYYRREEMDYSLVNCYNYFYILCSLIFYSYTDTYQKIHVYRSYYNFHYFSDFIVEYWILEK